MTLQEAYDTLGLPRNAAAAQVKAAYRKRVAEAHPDRGGETADFIRVRAAYEILSAFLHEPAADDEAPVPSDLRSVIDAVVREFRQQQQWAEAETLGRLQHLEAQMSAYVSTASRAELRRFSSTFRTSWEATINAVFSKCNSKCDGIIAQYETWYAASTQAVFDEMYRRELVRFVWSRRFWEVFLVLAALAGGLGVVVGWGGAVRPWISGALLLVAFVLAFLAHRWAARRERRTREKVEPLSVVVFQLDERARFETETRLRRGQRTTAALGLAGALLGNAASGGFALPVVGGVAGAALGGAFDRFLNPTGRMREGLQEELQRFMALARPQVTGYVLEAHQRLLAEVRVQIVENYQERVRGTVRRLAAGDSAPRRRPGRRAVSSES